MLHGKVCKECRKPTMNRNGYCDDCSSRYASTHLQRRIPDAPRRKTAERGYDNRWNVFARKFLADHRVCALCGAPATCVDHRDMTAQQMLAVYGQFILDESYYQALCTRCNVRKGAREDRASNDRFDSELRALLGGDPQEKEGCPHDQRK